MASHQLNWLLCSGQTALAHTYTNCVICTRGRASPPSTVRQRTLSLSSLYPSDKCELSVSRLRTALQVLDRPAEPLPYPQIRGTDNVILETGTTMLMMNVILNLQMRCAFFLDQYRRKIFFVVDVSINWVINSNWHTKVLDILGNSAELTS